MRQIILNGFHDSYYLLAMAIDTLKFNLDRLKRAVLKIQKSLWNMVMAENHFMLDWHIVRFFVVSGWHIRQKPRVTHE